MRKRSAERRERRKRALRVRLPVETVSAATEMAEQLARDGVSADVQFDRVMELLSDRDLARAIVSHVGSRRRSRTRSANHERALGIYCAGMGAILIFLMAQAALWLF